MRLFLAINPPAEVRRDLMAATAPLRDVAPELSWTSEGRIHLTIKFLGDVPDERAGEIEAAMAAVAARYRETAMTVAGAGAFPNFRRARVVWIGVHPDPRLELLHHDVEVAFERLGFPVEGRPFRPHMTLARVKHRLPEETLRELSRAAKAVRYQGEFAVRSVELMRSDLTAAGAAYTTLASAALRRE